MKVTFMEEKDYSFIVEFLIMLWIIEINLGYLSRKGIFCKVIK